jgi:hypothetical protein
VPRAATIGLTWGGLALLCAARWAGAAEQKQPARTPALETSCVTCHLQLDGAAREPARRAAEDVHVQKGLSCHDCHGGDPTPGLEDPSAAHDEGKGWTGKPARLRVPQLCARCHADADFMKRFNPHTRVDQLSEYRTSVHGKRNAAGDLRPAVCIDCHGVHGIQPVADPRSSVHPTRVAATCARCHADEKLMGAYGLPADQHASWRTSVHAGALYERGDLSAPTCNDCHGSHGAVPPGVDSVANVCGSCHGREASLFRETEAKRKIDLTLCIRCVICHDNHAVQAPTAEMLGVSPKGTCVSCHSPGEPEYAAAEQMAAASTRLRSSLAAAREALGRAERAGMEVSADRVALQAAQDKVVETRVLVHSFDRERFLAAAGEGAAAADRGLAAADRGLAAAERAFRELRRRRVGLGVSLLLIAAVIAGLVVKIRQLDGERDL